MELFNYKGREWFNVGTGCILFAVIGLTQLFWTFTPNNTNANLWYVMLVYFAGFGSMALALLSKRVVANLTATIVAGFMVFQDILWLVFHNWTTGGNAFPATFTETMYRTMGNYLAIIGVVLFALAIADVAFEFTKININTNFMPIAGFGLMLMWAIVRLFCNVAFNSMGSGELFITSLALNIMIIPFLVFGMMALLKEINSKYIPFLDEQTLNNIAFLFAGLAFMVAILRWSYGGILNIFGS
jgi:hypothetical protein